MGRGRGRGSPSSQSSAPRGRGRGRGRSNAFFTFEDNNGGETSYHFLVIVSLASLHSLHLFVHEDHSNLGPVYIKDDELTFSDQNTMLI